MLVGDPCQLSATVFAKGSTDKGIASGFSRSLFERLVVGGHPLHLLDTQYRMHPAIAEHASALYYGGQLKHAVALRPTAQGGAGARCRQFHGCGFAPFLFFDLESGSEQRRGGGSPSLRNVGEAQLLLCVYRALREAARERGELPAKMPWAAVITPYAEQLSELKRRFRAAGLEEEVELNTVDSFQGREQEVVLFSAVRTGSTGRIGFVADSRRLNVAMTRGRVGCYLIGRRKTLMQDPGWAALLERAVAAQSLVTVPPPRRNVPAGDEFDVRALMNSAAFGSRRGQSSDTGLSSALQHLLDKKRMGGRG
eukprot:COSAG01_NODE_2325_length_7907_cov_4.765881_5_plen_310_part_00